MNRLLQRPLFRFCLFLAVAGPWATAAFGSSGVLEINQTCAVETGCVSGDTPGFPVTIDGSSGRSYRLTSDLVIPDTSSGGIQISAASISIDLNGFSIVGVDCVAATSDCRPASGSGSGVILLGGFDGASVRNGSVVGMGGSGIAVGSHSIVEGIRARWNRLDGINVGSYALVQNCTSFQNGRDGITGTNAVQISGNTSNLNLVDGINAAGGSVVVDNVARQNGDDGIVASSGSLVRRNVMNSNGDFGLVANSSVAYGANTIVGNAGGTVSGGPASRGNNLCSGTGTSSSFCP